MSYTIYPAEAKAFASLADEIKGEINKVQNGLNASKDILSSCNNKDLIVNGSLSGIEIIINRIKSMESAISSDISTVKKIANDLESEEYQRIQKQQSEKENSGDLL